MTHLVSVKPYLSLLQEPEPELQVHGLKHLNELVDQFWMEIANAGANIEVLYEDDAFPERQLAALLLSRMYFHLSDYDQAMSFALGAGDLFDLSEKSEFVETIIAHCVELYITSQQHLFELRDEDNPNNPQAVEFATKQDERLARVVEKMFQRCIDDKEYTQALGVAFEARRADIITEILKITKDSTLLDWVLRSAMEHVRNLEWRNKILSIVVSMQRKQPEPDHFAICTCLVHLNDPKAVANDLMDLVLENVDSYLTALQIAFDLTSSATQEFLERTRSYLLCDNPNGTPRSKHSDGESVEDAQFPNITSLLTILSGEKTIGLNLDFLFRSNKTDIVILNKIRDSLESRNSIFHSALTFANAYMHAGTTIDSFIRDNLEWLGRATNWAKFSATAALGVIHRGHLSQGQTLLAPYLPVDNGSSSSVYTEGGSLFGLGLIFANHGSSVSRYLSKQLQNANDEVVQHGAALGLGVAGIASADENSMDILRNKLFNDSAVAGEACGIAMGLTMLGTADYPSIEEMLRYTADTQHEKIVRGLAIGIALILYGKEDIAENFIPNLLNAQDPLLRVGGAYTIALAYVGTGDNFAIKKLLHVASSDPSDDVRRVAVLSLGFVLCKDHTAVPRIVEILSESYNPHVRYGAAMALGIACAGTGLNEAIDILEPMLKDTSDFVRQGVLIAMAMILIQHNEQSAPRVVAFRQTLEKVYSNRHEDALAKFGAALAQGILDAGGRNVTISLQTTTGAMNMEAIIGIALFTYSWYWYPLAHCLSLAFTPTALIGLNIALKIPKFEFVSNAKPSLFAYPPPTVTKQDTTIEKVNTAVLSTTLKAKMRAKKTEKEKAEKEGGDLMDMDNQPADEEDAEKMETDEPVHDGDAKEKKKKKAKKEEEPHFEMLSNLSRVVPAQLKYISFPEGSRFAPIKKPTGGVLIMKDLRPDEEEELMEMKVPLESANGDAATSDGEEAPPPAPFDFHSWDE